MRQVLACQFEVHFCYGLVGTCGRSSKECDPNVSVRRIEPSFRKEGGRQLPFGNPVHVASDPFWDTEVFHIRILYFDLPRRF